MEFIDSLLAADGQTFSVHHKGQNHTLLWTVRKGGYFKLIMVPSAELGLGGGPEVTLVFSSKDLYFLGVLRHRRRSVQGPSAGRPRADRCTRRRRCGRERVAESWQPASIHPTAATWIPPAGSSPADDALQPDSDRDA